MIYHLIAFISGFIIDLILGDPYIFPHPVKLMGKMIGALDAHFLGKKDAPLQKSSEEKQKDGVITALLVIISFGVLAFLIIFISYRVNHILGIFVESIMTYQMLATKCLKVESMKVYDKLKNASIEEARFAVSMIVGRDTKNLTDIEVAKAAVETVAENTSDGIIAPMFYLFIGGPVLAFMYKAINTMDSMIGYKNDRYLDFGRFAAKLDDVVNFIPARISAVAMIFAAVLSKKDFDYKNALKIFKRDRYNHASPNSAQTESVCAGALGLKLAGPASYFGVIHDKPYIGDENREICFEDIIRANKLMYLTAFTCEIFFSVLIALAALM